MSKPLSDTLQLNNRDDRKLQKKMERHIHTMAARLDKRFNKKVISLYNTVEIQHVNNAFEQEMEQLVALLTPLPAELAVDNVLLTKGAQDFHKPMIMYAMHYKELVNINDKRRAHEEILDNMMFKQIEEYIIAKDRCKNLQTYVYTNAELLKAAYNALNNAFTDRFPDKNVFAIRMDVDSIPTKMSPEIKSRSVIQTPAQIAAETSIKALSVEVCAVTKNAKAEYEIVKSNLINENNRLFAHGSNDRNAIPIQAEVLRLKAEQHDADLNVRIASKAHVTSIMRIIDASRCAVDNPVPVRSLPRIPAPEGAAGPSQKPAAPKASGKAAALKEGGSSIMNRRR